MSYSTIKERKDHNTQVVNFCYKQHDCTAVQSVNISIPSIVPHRPTVFSATTMEFSQRATDSAVTVDNRATFLRKISSSVICFRFIRSGGLATANGLRLSSSSSHSYMSVSDNCRSSAQAEYSLIQCSPSHVGHCEMAQCLPRLWQCSSISFERSLSIARRRTGVDC